MKKALPETRLNNSIDEAFTHLKRLLYAGGKIKDFVPLKEKCMDEIGDEKIGYIDQFIFRFMKLQDCMGMRVFPALLEYLQEDYRKKPFLDIIHRLEQLGVIENAFDWQQLRELRNSLAHEYPENKEENMEALNLLFNKTPVLLGILRTSTRYAGKTLDKVFPDVPEFSFRF